MHKFADDTRTSTYNKNIGKCINQNFKLFSCDMMEGAMVHSSTYGVNTTYILYFIIDYSIGIIIYVSRGIVEGFDLYANMIKETTFIIIIQV